MRTIYQTAPGSLITTNDRSISFFPSGLVRVDQVYVGNEADETNHRSVLGYGLRMPYQVNVPVIDGLFIFPEVQESRDGSGFNKYQCSAYGRTTDEYRELSRSRNTLRLAAISGNITPQIEIVVYNMQGTIVKKNGEVIEVSDIEFPIDFLNVISAKFLNDPLIVISRITEISVNESLPLIRTYSAQYPEAGFPDQTITFNVQDPFIQITAQRNFGEFVEYEFSANRIQQEPSLIE
tara:strand:- start:1743 stop:2450 length:708 start_codon:yes stop_codon:yes gene_type:complete